ncbi:hypothetical protein BG258_07360 [Lysinibacillus fusiformis]|uniref:Uncharacterized protein n=1 Tax=Lysinibacillus fusiformis TaxID=28031 RepID=A0A1E4R5M0_9BACI|nr:hypothetical protein BG258_07360 [Lysinibacillus fusiformis]
MQRTFILRVVPKGTQQVGINCIVRFLVAVQFTTLIHFGISLERTAINEQLTLFKRCIGRIVEEYHVNFEKGRLRLTIIILILDLRTNLKSMF